LEKLQAFVNQLHVQRFQKGEIILVQEEIPRCAYIIKSGVIKTYNLTSQGEEKPISFDIENEIIPLSWVFGRARFAQYFYEAFTDCELYCFPREKYIEFLRQNPDYLFSSFEYFISRYLNYQMRVNALEQSKASEKVLSTIHYLALRFGRDIKPHRVEIQLPLTQQDLANFMGLTRETTSMELKKLQNKGVINYSNQRYVVNTEALDSFLDEDYEFGIVENEKRGQKPSF
jgi:CRP-like cAMP-binding protein